MTLDARIFEFLFRFAHRSALLDSFLVFCAEYLPYFLFAGLVLFILSEKEGRNRWFYFSALALAAILARGIFTELLHFFYHHPRPSDALGILPLFRESGNSFPSGHTALFFALAGTLLFRSRRWGLVYMLCALLIGLARIAAGVHWPLDVVGGALVGLLSAFIVNVLVKKYGPGASAS